MSFDLKKLENNRILVAGDIMLDRYVWGNVSRISPEAPVPVVKVNDTSEVIGGAGNVAANLAGLGNAVTLMGIRGNDTFGDTLESLCKHRNIDTSFLSDDDRPTTTKTRVMAQKQQLFRLDEEEIFLLDTNLKAEFISLFQEHLKSARVVVLSDYGKGIMQTPGLCRKLITLCRENRIHCLVDPKGNDWKQYTGASCITPNTSELEAVTSPSFDSDEPTLFKTVTSVKAEYELECLLLTRGPKGMCVADSEDPPLLIPTKAREVFDVSGAGDTVIATLASGLAAGCSFRQAAELANTAAGIVVGKVGTQPVSAVELDLALKADDAGSKLSGYFKSDSVNTARVQTEAWKAAGETVVFTNGCFDLLHPGHVDLLHKSRALGHRLVVGLNSDSSVKRLKGPTRPILAEHDRASILSALGCVDLVVIFDEDTPLQLLEILKPDILVKGADYTLDEVVGRDLVESYGGHVALVPLIEGYSTSGIEQRIIETHR